MYSTCMCSTAHKHKFCTGTHYLAGVEGERGREGERGERGGEGEREALNNGQLCTVHVYVQLHINTSSVQVHTTWQG